MSLPSWLWRPGGGGGGAPACSTADHASGACNCFASGAAVAQTLDELEFSRSACQAAAAGQVERLRRALDRAPDAVHSDGAKGTSGYTPLHYAARAGRLDCAALLLDRGAAVGARTAQGRATPLHRAAHAGHLPVVELLVSRGADGCSQDADGETPLHKAAAEGHAAAAAFLLARFPQSAALRDRRGLTPADRAAGQAAALDWHRDPDCGGGGGGGASPG